MPTQVMPDRHADMS
jgi:GTPase